jgi:hypothetical protein
MRAPASRGHWCGSSGHLPAITPEEIATMEPLNPKSAAQVERDKGIDDFLNGPSGR